MTALASFTALVLVGLALVALLVVLFREYRRFYRN